MLIDFFLWYYAKRLEVGKVGSRVSKGPVCYLHTWTWGIRY